MNIFLFDMYEESVFLSVTVVASVMVHKKVMLLCIIALFRATKLIYQISYYYLPSQMSVEAYSYTSLAVRCVFLNQKRV